MPINPKHPFWIALLLLTACGTVPPYTPTVSTGSTTVTPAPSKTSAPTATPVPSETHQPPYEYIIVSDDTCTSIASAFNVSVESIIDINHLPSSCNTLMAGQRLLIPYSSTSPHRPTPTLSPTPTPLSKFPMDGYVMVFNQHGELYFQDGNNLPVKLADISEKSSPTLSDDNQKVIFYRDDGNTYAINTDGTDERLVIQNSRWISTASGTNYWGFSFIPHTHQLLLETDLCESQEYGAPCSVKLFITDIDTGKTWELMDLGLAYQHNRNIRNIEVSPNGKMIAVGTMNGVDIFKINGKIIRHNILSYKPSQSPILFPSIFWLPDSSGLIVALPNAFYVSMAYNDDFPASTIWRYTIDSNVAVQIPFDPPPMSDTFQVSPNGNWIVYGGLGYDTAVYLGNLIDGHTEILGDAEQVDFSWEPDSKYFTATSGVSILGAIDKPTLTPICHLDQWISPGHFTCWNAENTGLRLRMAEIDGEIIKMYDIGLDREVESYLFIKPK